VNLLANGRTSCVGIDAVRQNCAGRAVVVFPTAMTAYLYPISLAALSGLMVVLERFFPWRPAQKQLRPKLWSDVIHLVFNGHFLGLLLAGLAERIGETKAVLGAPQLDITSGTAQLGS